MTEPIPSMEQVKNSLAELQTQVALLHMDAALQSLERLSKSLQEGDRPAAAEQREMERSLLKLKTELREAGYLAEQGLAFCKGWAEAIAPPASYCSDGAAQVTEERHHDISIQA
jgi:soluble cytochrome b562